MPALHCVTGASGYVASELVRQLLVSGQRVRGTVRKLGSSRASQLEQMALAVGAEARLELMEADLLQPCSFRPAIQGCDFLHHVASPFVFGLGDPQTTLIDPALQGTRNVLSTAAEFKGSLKCVVVTSSVAGRL